MGRRIAVITNALSSGFYFPLWYGYYGRLFDAANLFVVTFRGRREEFAPYRLGGLWELPHGFNDEGRARSIGALVATLLTCYDAVVYTDTDEFLVPDPRRHADLRAYLADLGRPYVTARGFDLVQRLGDPPLRPGEPVLVAQRRHALPNSWLNKTCFTTLPLQWCVGFHGCTVHPMLDELFLLHLKRSDVELQAAWTTHISDSLDDDPKARDYYRTAREQIADYHAYASGLPVVAGWPGLYREAPASAFLASQVFHPHNGMYISSSFPADPVLVEIPEEFRGAF